MKKILILILLVLFCTGSVFGGEFETQLKLAKQGDVNAQYNIGIMYYFGDEKVTKDFDKAIYWFEKAAEQGYAKAQSFLGSVYSSLGYVAESMGLEKEATQNYKKAFYWFKKLAEQGDVAGQSGLGNSYYSGHGVMQDYKKAFYWFEKAAEQGDDSALCSIGLLYYNGNGTTQNYKKAIYYLKKSAEQGNSLAQYYLGGLYADGHGVKQNYKQAYMWYSLSAAQDNIIATDNRDLTAKKLTPQQLAEAQELAAQMQEKIDSAKK